MCGSLSSPSLVLISASSTVSSSELRMRAMMIKDLPLSPRPGARWRCEKRCRGYKLVMMGHERRSSSWGSSNGPSHLTYEPSLPSKDRTSTEKARCWTHGLAISQITIELTWIYSLSSPSSIFLFRWTPSWAHEVCRTRLDPLQPTLRRKNGWVDWATKHSDKPSRLLKTAKS